MADAGVNLAITRDGGTYNKLQRPDNYLMGATAQLPPLPALNAPQNSSKRKRDQEVAPDIKRARNENKKNEEDLGMRTMLPSLDDEEHSDDATNEALAYLRSVR